MVNDVVSRYRTHHRASLPKREARRFMTEIPLAASGPWEPGAQDAMRAGLAEADARKATT